MKIKFKQKW